MSEQKPGGTLNAEACAISFIMPAFNEEEVIAASIDAIHKSCGGDSVEIIVVDHGSADKTADIAEAHAARVVDGRDCETIAELRNLGAGSATSHVLVFVDADVHVTEVWRKRMDFWITTLCERPLEFVTGSRCGISLDSSWVERAWFQPMVESRASKYINSGHMVMAKALFDRLGGFDPMLRTAEDCDLCRRAAALGARILSDPELKVVHEGYPKTLSDFYMRERWHGQQDVATLSRFMQSRAAMAGVMFTGFAALGLLAAAVLRSWLILFFLLAILVIMPAIGVRLRQGTRRTNFWGATLLLATYLLARGTSIFSNRRRWRQSELN